MAEADTTGKKRPGPPERSTSVYSSAEAPGRRRPRAPSDTAETYIKLDYTSRASFPPGDILHLCAGPDNVFEHPTTISRTRAPKADTMDNIPQFPELQPPSPEQMRQHRGRAFSNEFQHGPEVRNSQRSEEATHPCKSEASHEDPANKQEGQGKEKEKPMSREDRHKRLTQHKNSE